MSERNKIELAILGRLYRRICQICDKAAESEDRAYDQLAKQLRAGERRGVLTIGCVLVDEFAQPILGRNKESVFDNDIFAGRKAV